MVAPRTSTRYLNDLYFFLNFSFEHATQGDDILCPCKECNNCTWGNWKDMHEHLMCVGFDRNYIRWVFHREGGSSKKIYDNDREKYSMCKDLNGLLEETFMMPTNLGENEFNDIIDGR